MAAKKGLPRLVRKICLWCQGDSPKLVRECVQVDCSLHPHRHLEDGDDNLLRGCIRAFCLCCAGSADAVFECAADQPLGGHKPCPAHPYRLPEAVGIVRKVRQIARPLPGLEVAPVTPQPLPEDDPPKSAANPTPARPCPVNCLFSSGLTERAPEALDI